MTARAQTETNEEGQNESTNTSRLCPEILRPMPGQFRPYFTCLLSLAQLLMFTWLCSTTAFTEIGLSPKACQRIEPFTFRGNVTVTHIERSNPLIGPSRAQLISLGALFPPCMREDHAFNVYQLQALRPRLGKSGEKLGCCEVAEVNAAGTATEEECSALSNDTARWTEVHCSQRSAFQSSVQHTLRPCCKEYGQCALTSPEHCWFMKGRFHLHVEHCTQVDCLQQLCTLGDEITTDNYVTQFTPRRANQWWRLLTSLHLHQGILDYLLITCIQIWFCRRQEIILGWLRMALVYHTAGVGGHLVGSLFTKHDSPQAGASPAVGGVMALAVVEHVILRRTLRDPKRRLVLLLGSLFALFCLGTLPQVNNFSLMTGLLYGCMCALVFWGPLVFRQKLALCQFIVVFVIVVIFLFSFALFYGLQQITLTSFFRYMNCIPYAKGLCD